MPDTSQAGDEAAAVLARGDRPPWYGRLWHAPRDEFSPEVLDVLEAPTSPIRSIVACALVALLLAAFGWAWFGHLSEYAEAAGRIQVIGRSKAIEPQRIGSVLAVPVHNGDRVKQGDVLVRLDPTEAQASVDVLVARLTDLRAEIIRWHAAQPAIHAVVIDPMTQIAWPETMPAVQRDREAAVLRATLAQLAATLADLEAQRRAFEVTCDGLIATIAAERALMATLAEQLGMTGQLQQEGWNSQARLLEVQASNTEAVIRLSDLERQLADARAAIPVVEAQMVTAREGLAKTGEEQIALLERDADALEQKLVQARQTLRDMTLVAPVTGRVEAAALTTVGQVVKPGQQLMLVVPEDGALEIEAYVPNSSAGFLREGDPVSIKVQTYLYTNYGTVPGRITRVARDSLSLLQRDKVQTASLDGTVSAVTAAQATATLVYPITVVPERTTMLVDGREMPLAAGMSVQVDVLTERRRLLDYLISPLIELYATSVHER